jgi:hypothetical protein
VTVNDRRERPNYSRVYWKIVDDDKFQNVYDDDVSLAAWLRLLLIADQAWPASAHLPADCRPKAVKVLAGAGLIELRSGSRYRVIGLDAERERRSGEQSNGGIVRARTGERGANGRYLSTSGGPAVVSSGGGPAVDPPATSSDETRRDETRRALPRANGGPPLSLDEDGYHRVVQWLAARGAWIDSPRIETDLARDVDRKGADAVLDAMAGLTGAEDAAQYVYGAHKVLFPLPKARDLERQERQDDERKRHEAELARTRRIVEEDAKWRAS